VGERGKIGRTIARVERRVVGGFMRIIAMIAERRVRRSLDDKAGSHRGRAAVHVDLEDRLR
jgi:hypothetical protein